MSAEIHLMSGYAPKEALARLGLRFEQQTGVKPVFHYSVLSAIHDKLAAGERPDIIIMSVGLIDGYVKKGVAEREARATLGIVRTGVAVRTGGKAPDLSSLEAFRNALSDARSIAHPPAAATPSGAHCAKMMEQLGIADLMAKKTLYRPALEGGLEAIVSGEADFGIYPKSEIVNVAGVSIVGLLPPGVAFDNNYGAGAIVGSAVSGPAAEFVKFLAAPASRQVWTDAGFDPPEA